MAAKHSTEHLTDEVERLRRMVLWTVEWIDFLRIPQVITKDTPPDLPCRDCGHDVEHHHGEDDGVGAPCLYPSTLGAPMVLCRCQAYEPQSLGDS